MYDIFLVGKKNDTFEKLKSKFILAKQVSSFDEAQSKTLTDFFWVVWDDLEVDSDFDFEYEPDAWSQEFIHAFLNEGLYNGICLVPRKYPVSQKEIKSRYFEIKKEVPLLASRPKVFDTFEIDTWEDYERALEESSTDMFWMTSKNISVDKDILNQQRSFEHNVNHAFLHDVGKDDLYNGVYLLSKSNLLTKREIEYRHIVNRKEWDIVASKPVKYEIFTVDTWEEYQYALENSKTEMFWATSKNIKIDSNFKFDNYFSHDNTYDRTNNHAFIHRANGEDYYNGLFLLSKHSPVTKREIEHRHIINRKEWKDVASGPIEYEIFPIDTWEDYEYALQTSNTELFWGTSSNIDADIPDLYFSHNNEYDRKINHAFIHRVKGEDHYNGLFLFSKHAPVTQREIEHRHIVERKEWDIVGSRAVKYDIFEIDSWEDYQYALENSKTEMFWMSSKNIEIDQDFMFDLYFTHENGYDRTANHAFKHKVDGVTYYNGLFLCSRHTPLTRREVENRFVVNVKEYDIIASGPKQYEIFTIDTYEEYKNALDNCKTELFYGISRNIEVDFDFNIYFPHNNQYDRTINHAFIHRVKDIDYYNGLFLFSKHAPVTQREIEHRHIVNRKEWDTVASVPKKYDIFTIETYEQYLEAMENSTTEMFWAVTPNVYYNAFEFDTYFVHNNEYDRHMNHAFAHEVNGEKLYNGIFLLSKHSPVTKREIEHRHIINRKEWDTVASINVSYDKFEIDTWEDYKRALENSTTEMFWGMSNNIEIINYNIFELYFTHNNEYDRKINHTFGHEVNGKTYYNGLFLFSKHAPVTQNEIEHRHIVERKEWLNVVSGPVKYDIFDIDSWEEYQYALKNSKTELFWATSKNIEIDQDFMFDVYFTHDNGYDRTANHAFIHKVNGVNYYNGVFLLSTHALVTRREIENKFIVNVKEWDVVASGPKQYDIFTIDTYEEYQYALENSTTEMFWGMSNNIEINFDFDVYFVHNNDYDRKTNHAFIHRVDNVDYHNGLFLFSKHSLVTSKEIEHRHIINRKEWDVVASGPKQYDRFIVETYDDYLEALETSTTEMFWASSYNIDTSDFNFDTYFVHNNEYDRTSNHAFIHLVDGEPYYNGLFLLSKHKPVTAREINKRFIVGRKEWDIVASTPVLYDVFNIDTWEEYQQALIDSKTELFWGVSKNVEYNLPTIYFTYDNEYDRFTNHAFIHRVKGDDLYNGIFLFSKKEVVTQREIEHRHIVSRKEWNIVASSAKQYDKFVIDTYAEYLTALKNSTTEMFWATSRNIKIDQDFMFDIYFPHNEEYDRNINHAFAHKTEEELLHNGLFLLSKHSPLSEREIEHRHLVNKKEWDLVASGPIEYNKFYIDTYEEYERAFEESNTEMFWVIPNDVDILPTFEFDTYFPHNEDYNRKTNHAFLNGQYHDGIWLCSQWDKITKREFEYRYTANKHEIRKVISTPKPFDVVFISYQEPNANENYERLLKKVPSAKRIHGVKGIHQAHIEAAKLCDTDMVWIVDGDAIIVDEFDFDYQVPRWERDTVHVWRSQNPVNDLIYGYGGVKLFPRELTLHMDTSKPDMTTSISSKFKPVQEVSNITKFNTGEFETWKSAFRECVKLASKVIDRQKDDETGKRLQVWCKEGLERPYGEYAIAGAKAGFDYGVKNRGKPSKLKLINDFEWLKEQFNDTQQ